MKLNNKLLTELERTLEEIPDPTAVVTFVISETEDEEEQQIKVIACLPTGHAEEVRQLISEAMDRVVETKQPPSDMPFEDKVALSICETFSDALDEKQQSLWDFNEDALDLCDALVSANLCRDALHDWYWPFRSWMEDKPWKITPALKAFVQRGPEGNAQEIAALWTVCVCHLIPVDHNDPPETVSETVDDAATHYVASFLETIARQTESH